MIRLVMLLSAALLLAASGVSHRLWTGVWKVSNEPAESAARLADVPTIVGDWVGADTDVDKQQLDRAEAAGYLSRRYLQRRTGAEVSVFIICGRPGPIAVHTPDVCYGGLGFQVVGATHRYQYSGDAETPPADFIWANFEKHDVVAPPTLRIYWAWKSGRGWRAPSNPRMTFGGASALYKLYLIYRPAPGAALNDHDPCQDFMSDFLPELEKALSPVS
jgi:Protein of unknown function (DUF3485)